MVAAAAEEEKEEEPHVQSAYVLMYVMVVFGVAVVVALTQQSG